VIGRCRRRRQNRAAAVAGRIGSLAGGQIASPATVLVRARARRYCVAGGAMVAPSGGRRYPAGGD